jgi:hypothetical protein
MLFRSSRVSGAAVLCTSAFAVLAAQSAHAGVPAAEFSTLHGATISATYALSGFPQPYSLSSNFTASSNAVFNVDYFGPNSVVRTSIELSGDSSVGIDTLGSRVVTTDGAIFTALAFTMTWDIEFASSLGGVQLTDFQAPNGFATVTDALGNDVSSQAFLANGRYTITYSNEPNDVRPYGIGVFMEFEPYAVPAPGAIALLGLAGLANRRRR